MWAAGFGGSQTTDGNATLGSNTATSRFYGTAVGADYRFSPYTIAGFSMAGGGTNFSAANNGTGRSDLFQAGAFIRHTVGPAYISAALAYGWQAEMAMKKGNETMTMSVRKTEYQAITIRKTKVKNRLMTSIRAELVRKLRIFSSSRTRATLSPARRDLK